MGRLFGTDGIRGIANEMLNSDLAMKVGLSTGSFFKEINGYTPTFIIGTDTRISKDMLSLSIMSGLCASGANVIDLGVIPTPAVAYLVKRYNADAGIMITASHNPANYNGIKIFNGDGYKLNDEIEAEIESRISLLDANRTLYNCDVTNIGRKIVGYEPERDYSKYLINIGGSLTELNVVFDCANGASSQLANVVFSSLGVNTTTIGDKPDGLNINKFCGSTNLDNLQEYINSCGKRNTVGFAFDGDADRCLAVDEAGELVDGDELIAIIAKYLKSKGVLKYGKNTVVGTIMSNFGLKQFCKKEDINFVDTKVGDRYVLEAMLMDGYIIGGEQSGHVILKQYATTGDGLLTAVMILKIMKETKLGLRDLKKVMKKYPQCLENIEVSGTSKVKFLNDKTIKDEIDFENGSLKDEGRVLVRASGTESIIRVMAEAKSDEHARSLVKKYSDIVRQRY